ncbi:MAG: hypothetical protein AB1631_32280 [Acidobacteriota bacterium]
MLGVTLSYIYAGREEEAWKFFDENYKLDDKEDFKSKIKDALSHCPIYRYIYNR